MVIGLKAWASRHEAALHVACLTMVCAIAHAWSVGSYFAYDDWYFLSLARKWTLGQLSVLAPDASNSFGNGGHVRWYLLYRAFGDWGPGYHIVSVVLHLLATVGVYFLAKASCKRAGVSFGVAALFCVAAGHSEVVYWISGGYPAVAAIFAFGALGLAALYLGERGSSWHLVLCGVVCCLGIGATTRGLFALLPVFFAPVVLGVNAERRKALALRLMTALIGGAWVGGYLLYAWLTGPAFRETGYHSFMTLRGFWTHLWSALPLFLMPDLTQPAFQHRVPEAVPGILGPLMVILRVVGACVAALFVGNLAFGSWRNRFWAAFSTAGVVLGALCFAGFAGRYLYLPMIGFCMILATHLASLLGRSQSRAWHIGVPALLAFLVLSNAVVGIAGGQYYLRNARERQAIVASLRSYSTRTGERRISVSGLPEKYQVRLECGAELYGIKLRFAGSDDDHTGYTRLRYSGDGRFEKE